MADRWQALAERRIVPIATIRAVAVALVSSLSFSSIASVTQGDIREAESTRYATGPLLFDYAQRLAQRLTPDTPPEIILDSVNLLARACVEIGRGDIALNALSNAITLAAQINDPMRLATLKQARSRAKFFMGLEAEAAVESSEAMSAQRAIAPSFAEHPDPTRLIDELFDYATIQRAVGGDGNSISSLRLIERLLPLSRVRARHEIGLDFGLADILQSFADYEPARKRLLSALEKAERSGEIGWLLELLHALTINELDRGDLVAAERSATRHLDTSRQQNSRLGEANAALSLAEIHRLQQDSARAYARAAEAVRLHDRLDDALVRASARRELALAAAATGRVEEAKKLLAEMLALRPENSSDHWAHRAAQLRTQIAIASKNGSDAIALRAREELLAYKRQASVTAAQIRALREYHEVNARELELEALLKQNAVSEVVIKRDQTRIFWQRVAITASLATLLAVGIALFLLARRANSLRVAAETDALTGVNSRAAILAAANSRCAEAQANGESLAVCVLDIDRFKQFNDTFGHAVGDRVLVHCVDIIRKTLRRNDAVGRIGGDEFLLVLRSVNEANAQVIIDRIVATIAREPLLHNREPLFVSVSAGIAEFEPGSESSMKQLIQRADRALLNAKQRGKNRVERFSMMVEQPAMGVV